MEHREADLLCQALLQVTLLHCCTENLRKISTSQKSVFFGWIKKPANSNQRTQNKDPGDEKHLKDNL